MPLWDCRSSQERSWSVLRNSYGLSVFPELGRTFVVTSSWRWRSSTASRRMAMEVVA
jgi:hypothetical protein